MRTRSRTIDSAILALTLMLVSTAAQAHEPGADVLPEAPGWQLGGALAVVLPAADQRWPAANWPGVLVQGSAPPDQRRGLRLEHATLDLAARLNPWFGVQLAAGWHDRDDAHLEAAQLQGRLPAWGGELSAVLGRDTVRLGAVIDGAGHFDRFSQPPLAQRAVFDGPWVDDGLRVGWRRGPGADPDADVNGLRGVEIGLWRGRAFPGGASGPAVPSVHLHAGWGHLDAHLGLARFEPEARGAAAVSLGQTGHVHGALDCRRSLQQRVCFDGRADVLGASLQWEPEPGDWTLALAGLLRRERGTLYATSGSAALDTTLAGVWADAHWRPAARWTGSARVERLVPKNRLTGVGTALLARDAGLADGAPVQRLSTALAYELQPGLELALEAGRERVDGGADVSHIALRAVWRSPRWLGGRW